MGLHLISTEFNESPRVALQLEGRVGRQGAFGSGRSLLVASDPGLSGMDFGELGTDDAGRACWQGRAVDMGLERQREAARLDAARARDITVEYGAVMDLWTHNYYRVRRDLVSGSAGLLDAWVRGGVSGAVTGLVSRHFPGLTVDGYAERFAALSHNVRITFGLDAGAALGCSLNDLDSLLGDLVTGRLEDMRRVLGRARFSELVRLLALGAGRRAVGGSSGAVAWHGHGFPARRFGVTDCFGGVRDLGRPAVVGFCGGVARGIPVASVPFPTGRFGRRWVC